MKNAVLDMADALCQIWCSAPTSESRVPLEVVFGKDEFLAIAGIIAPICTARSTASPRGLRDTLARAEAALVANAAPSEDEEGYFRNAARFICAVRIFIGQCNLAADTKHVIDGEADCNSHPSWRHEPEWAYLAKGP